MNNTVVYCPECHSIDTMFIEEFDEYTSIYECEDCGEEFTVTVND